MGREINDVAEFISNLKTNCVQDFLLDITLWSPKPFAAKNKIVEYIKELNFQFDVVPDLEAPLGASRKVSKLKVSK